MSAYTQHLYKQDVDLVFSALNFCTMLSLVDVIVQNIVVTQYHKLNFFMKFHRHKGVKQKTP